MKLKFINLLLAAFLLIGSAQALTSCKDTDEDLYAQLRDENLTIHQSLESRISELEDQIKNCITLQQALDAIKSELGKELENYVTHAELNTALAGNVNDANFQETLDKYIALEGTYNNLKALIAALKATQNELTSAHGDYENIGARFAAIEANLSTLQTTLTQYSTLVTNLDQTLTSYMSTTNSTLTSMSETLTSMGVNVTELQSATNSLNSFMNEWSPKLGDIEKNAADALAIANKNEADIAALTTTYQELQQLIINNQTATDAKMETLQNSLTTLEEKMQTILDDYTTSADVDQAITDAIAGLATQDALETLAAALRKEAQENLDAVELRLQEQIITIINRLNGLDTKMSDIDNRIKSLETIVNDFISNYPGTIDDILQNITSASEALSQQIAAVSEQLTQDIQGLTGNVETATEDILENAANIQKNKEAIEALEKRLDAVVLRVFNLENRITSIEIQGVESPVLGYLKTPFGIESNFFLSYMGETDHKVMFPNFYYDGVEYDGQIVITDDDIKIVGANIEGATTYEAGAVLFNEAEGNLGKIYLTLNPSNIDLTGKTFTVVTSQDKDTEIKLVNLRPSNVELTNGYSRTATSPNGFYEADVTVDKDKVSTIRIVVDKELKAAAKKVLDERSPSSLLGLGNAVYNQFNGFLPALGIKAAWQETVGDKNDPKQTVTKMQSVYSKYGMAAGAFNPLSYSFLYGKSFRQIHLPDLSGILDDYKFDFSENGLNIKFNPITIDGVNVNFSLNINPEIGDLNLGTVSTTTNVTIDDFPVGVDDDGNLITEVKVIPVDVNINLNESDLAANLSSAIEDALQNALSGLDGEINSQLQGVIDSLIGQIQGQVNDMMSSLENQVNTSLSDILGNLQDQVNGKIDMITNKLQNNALYNRLQAIVNRFNGVLADPNHYLQPTLLYSMKGASYGMLSTSKAFPSQFKGGEAVMLTPTTYTGEIVTPAFKKYVAVTNVYKSDNYKVNAQAGDKKCKELADAANAQPNMNMVVAGEYRTIPFSYAGGEGYTYEIVYQALDYSGITSTAKYYVSIKK